MPLLRKILVVVLSVLVLYGALLGVERLTTQELTRVAHPSAPQAVCLMWKPQFLRGNGIVYLDLRDGGDKLLATGRVAVVDRAFNALQQFGQLGFDGADITVTNLQTGEPVRRFAVREGRIVAVE